MKTLRETVRGPLIRVPGKARRLINLERGDFANALDQAESIGQRTQRVRVVIMVTDDPPEGRTVTIQPLGLTKQLGRRWRDWAEWWSGPWHELQRELLRPSAQREMYLPSDAALEEQCVLAGATAAQSFVRSKV